MDFNKFLKENKKTVTLTALAILLVSVVLILGNVRLLLLLAAIFIGMLLSKMLIIHEYGVSAAYFLLFGVVYVFGPMFGFLLSLLVGSVQVWLAPKKTPIDFCLSKDVGSAPRQSLLLMGATLGIWGLMMLFGKVWILGNLVMVYMGVLIFFWVVLYDIVRAFFTPIPLGKVALVVAVSMFFNFQLVAFFGLKYITWLGGFL